ncbi:MAG: Lrp/AsnC family transcriptional regulator [Deltaproteobacteria bacterium]|nr:Lrp/AsnC family transcriptional regulator [Deltaproteobacteria bacterium]
MPENCELSPAEKALVHALSGDLPLCPRPFAEIARRIGVSEEEALAMLRGFGERGLIRRFGAVLVHQRSGFMANAMLVWRFGEREIAEAGARLAALPYVTHCYKRAAAPGWPYNLYTMIHAGSRDELLGMAAEMARLTGAEEWAMLESVRELKKDSIRYFPEAAGDGRQELEVSPVSDGA